MDDDDVFFIYMGEGGALVPKDVVHVRVHPTVTVIPENAFYNHQRLVKVELCEGGYERSENKHLNVVSTRFQWRFPEHVILIYHEAFESCNNLRNLALSHETVLRGIIYFGIAPTYSKSLVLLLAATLALFYTH